MNMEWMREFFSNELMYHTAVAIAIIVIFYALSGIVRALLRWLAGKVFSKTETVLDDRITAIVLAHVKQLMLVVSFHIAVREIRKGMGPEDETLDQILDYGEAILYVVVVVLIVKILLGIVGEIIDWYLDRISVDDSVDLKRTLGPLTGKIINTIIGLIAVIIVLDHFGINIGSLLVSLGVGSLAVALAAQDTLANMIAGFVILVDRPFRVGDRIEIHTGQIGDVQEIGLRSTKLLNFDSNVIIIPNSELVKSRIINFAYPFNQMRVMVKVAVAYGTDPDKIRSILLELAGNHPDIVKEPAPEVHCTALQDSSIEFTLYCRASNFRERFAAENLIREQAYKKFAQEGIEIPFPQRVVHMKSKP